MEGNGKDSENEEVVKGVVLFTDLCSCESYNQSECPVAILQVMNVQYPPCTTIETHRDNLAQSFASHGFDHTNYLLTVILHSENCHSTCFHDSLFENISVTLEKVLKPDVKLLRWMDIIPSLH